MRVVLVVAAVAILYAAGPADAATKRPGRACAAATVAAPAAVTARAGRPTAARRSATRRRALRRRCARPRLVGRGSAGVLSAPGSFAAPAAFITAPGATAPAPGPAAPATEQPGTEAPPPVYSNPLALQVRAYEFHFRLSKSAVAAGDVKVEFNLSAAEDPHNLVLVREDGMGRSFSFGEEPAGAVVSRTFPLTTGRWTLLCSLTGHEAAGMRSTVTVGEPLISSRSGR